MPSDAEVICGFMYAKPDMPTDPDVLIDPVPLNPWWLLTTTGYLAGDDPVIVPCMLDLDKLREVEQKLIDMDIGKFYAEIRGQYEFCPEIVWHLTTKQKEYALARVIESLAEVIRKIKV